MSPIAKSLSVLAIVVATLAALASEASLPFLAQRFKLTWGSDVYVLVALPYVLLIVMAFAFRKTGAAISLGSSLLFGTFGLWAMFATRDAMGVAMVPVVLLLGCIVVLALQVVRWLPIGTRSKS